MKFSGTIKKGHFDIFPEALRHLRIYTYTTGPNLIRGIHIITNGTSNILRIRVWTCMLDLVSDTNRYQRYSVALVDMFVSIGLDNLKQKHRKIVDPVCIVQAVIVEKYP